jgi:GxxExxY protein
VKEEGVDPMPMHVGNPDSPFAADDPLSGTIIGAAIAVHKALGAGLLESVYHECMSIELEVLGVPFKSEVPIPMVYRARALNAQHKLDLIVDDRIIVELKAIDALATIHEAQLLTYLRLTNKRLGLLINFNVPLLREGLKRIVL